MLSNKDVVNFIVPFWEKGDASNAAKALADEARGKWESTKSLYIDDITCVVAFLDVKLY